MQGLNQFTINFNLKIARGRVLSKAAIDFQPKKYYFNAILSYRKLLSVVMYAMKDLRNHIDKM